MGMTYIIPFRRTTAIKKLIVVNLEDKAHIFYTFYLVLSYYYSTHLYLLKYIIFYFYFLLLNNKHVSLCMKTDSINATCKPGLSNKINTM